MTKWDKILIAFIFVASISGMIFTAAYGTNGGQRYAIVNVNGSKVKKISIENTKEAKNYEFHFDNHTGTIEVKDGAVRMLEMSREICLESICSDTGWIEKKYQSIVCLPNKIVVSIEDGQEAEIDMIAF
ncbi:NusG domain II-containing protein [Anaerosolibacter sp.]|uniref:NusG domain II-containing protein n=1 Tax=Anaerosolibacter sp. TaxID=1872527 RepID=UPI0039EEB03E